ncbi:MAG: hypothetical protein JSV88_21375, partial [Candidatus Aminicenantes bacterium]
MKKYSIILFLFVLTLFSLASENKFFINGKIKIGKYKISNSPAVYKKINETPVKELSFGGKGELALKTEDFKGKVFLRFSFQSNPRLRADENPWTVNIVKAPVGLKPNSKMKT